MAAPSKRLSLAALTLLAAAALAGCATSNSASRACPEGHEAHEPADADFRACPPEDWSVREDFMGSDVAAWPADYAGDGFRENVLVRTTPLPEGVSLEELVDRNEETLSRTITEYRLVDESPGQLGGEPARTLTFTGVQGVYDLRWRQTFAVRDGTGYVVGYTASQDAFAETLDEARAFEQAFSFG